MLKEIDLSYLDSLLGSFSDDLNAKMLSELTDENFTLAMFRAGFLTAETDNDGFVTGFSFTPPQNFSMLLTGTSGDDVLETNKGDDVVLGGAGRDTIRTGEGDDMLYGDSGSDFLYGEAGNDTLNGGTNIDNLYGGAGADTFTFTADSAFTGADFVRDFNAAEGDMIDISDLLTAYNPLDDAISDFVRITDNGTNTFVAVDADGGGDSFQNVAIILNTTGMTDEQVQIDSGTLIA